MKIRIKLDEQLKKRGMSQRELSRRTGIRHVSINEMCNNVTERVPLKNLAKICKELQCDISDILELVEEEKANQ